MGYKQRSALDIEISYNTAFSSYMLFPIICFLRVDGIDMADITSEMRARAFEEFKEKCENDYYVEYFWFPSQKDCWINCWKNDGKANDAAEYPCPFVVEYQEFTNNTIFRILPASFQMRVMSIFAMLDLPERKRDNPSGTPISEAIHFRRGTQNMRLTDMEWEIPIPGLKSDPSKADWSVVQKAWWAVLKYFHNRFN